MEGLCVDQLWFYNPFGPAYGADRSTHQLKCVESSGVKDFLERSSYLYKNWELCVVHTAVGSSSFAISVPFCFCFRRRQQKSKRKVTISSSVGISFFLGHRWSTQWLRGVLLLIYFFMAEDHVHINITISISI